MNSKILSLIGLTALAGLQGCSKYTDIKTEGALTTGDYANYRYLMNNTGDLMYSVDMPDISADDIVYKDTVIQQSLAKETLNAYMWGATYYDAVTADPDWRRIYASQYSCNLVTDNVMGANGGSTAEKEEVAAEAKVHRAYGYFMLVNMYGKQYDEATKDKDLGVPLLLKADVSVTATRATVGDVYTSIFDDLLTAIPYLPAKAKYNVYPSKAAAYAVLAKAYLQTNQYALAGKYADSALAIQRTLNDLPSEASSSLPNDISNQEIILSKVANGYHGYSSQFILSDDLISLYDPADYRYSYLTQEYQYDETHIYRLFAPERITYQNRNIGPSVPEMMLISAEASARAGQTQTSMDMINNLRATRFAPADYVALTATSPDDALVKVLQERRRELFCHCTRWFDQKRLNQDAKFAETLTRTNYVSGETFTLTPTSVRYVFPIPLYNIQINPALVQNPR